ncbi:MAG: hypothetical protein M1839_008554 [Geoglossum umbratile]|nr:MAG: hypothetical protein M1839_008554 [Geoglossum umbratile]
MVQKAATMKSLVALLYLATAAGPVLALPIADPAERDLLMRDPAEHLFEPVERDPGGLSGGVNERDNFGNIIKKEAEPAEECDPELEARYRGGGAQKRTAEAEPHRFSASQRRSAEAEPYRYSGSQRRSSEAEPYRYSGSQRRSAEAEAEAEPFRFSASQKTTAENPVDDGPGTGMGKRSGMEKRDPDNRYGGITKKEAGNRFSSITKKDRFGGLTKKEADNRYSGITRREPDAEI